MVTVSNNTQLLAALRNSANDPNIELTSGTYSLNLRSGNYQDAVITEADGATATFSKVDLRSVSHLTFDGVNFNLPTATKGIVIANSDDIAIQNSNISGSTAQNTKGIFVNNTDDLVIVNNTITGFATSMAFSNIDGLIVQSNDILGMSWDAMISGGVHHALYADNNISMSIPKGRLHTDGMQFYNNGGSALSDVTISNNIIETNGRSHGIYMGNNYAHTGGGPSAFFSNVVIDHNTIHTTNSLGIAVGETNHLTITDNWTSGIRVRYSSTDVHISDNNVAPKPSGTNWAVVRNTIEPWDVHDNNNSSAGAVQAFAAPDADTFHFDMAAIDSAHTFL